MVYILNTAQLFKSLVKNKKYKCPYCIKVFNDPASLYYHAEISHDEVKDDNRTVKQVIYDDTHPSEHLCQICKVRKCVWIEKTGHYSTLCDNPACREEARRRFRENYKKKHGKEHTIADPEIQKELQRNRRCAGEYEFQDKGKVFYMSKNEQDFLQFCDITLNLPSSYVQQADIVFEYMYEGKKHFYMIDYYMEPFDLLVEIKADDDISHPKILAVDKEKEALKDKAVIEYGKHNYIKIVDMRYEQFVELLEILKSNHVSQKKHKEERYIVIPERKKDIRGFVMPKLVFLNSIKDLTESIIMKRVLDQLNGKLTLSLIIHKDNVELKDDPLLKENDCYVCRTIEVDCTSDTPINTAFREFSHYYTKRCEHFINQDFMSIRMDLSKTNFFVLKVKYISKEAQRKLLFALLLYCENKSYLDCAFFQTSTGFVFIVGNVNDDPEHKKLSTYCNKLHSKSEYSKSVFDYDNTSVQAPGTIDANTIVSFIQE